MNDFKRKFREFVDQGGINFNEFLKAYLKETFIDPWLNPIVKAKDWITDAPRVENPSWIRCVAFTAFVLLAMALIVSIPAFLFIMSAVLFGWVGFAFMCVAACILLPATMLYYAENK